MREGRFSPLSVRKPGWTPTSGQSLVEFSLMAIVLVTVLVGIVDFGRVLMVQHIITNAAREGAHAAILGNLDSAQVRAEVERYLQRGGLDVSQATITITGANASSGQPVVVEVEYPVDSIVLKMIHANTHITLNTASRMLHE